MPKRVVIVIGSKFGRLTVVQAFHGKGKGVLQCVCDCGTPVLADSYQVRIGRTQSCGCLQREQTSKAKRTHGGRADKLYSVWHNIKRRCLDPTNKSWARYGGRGIKIYPAWVADYAVFAAHIGPRPSPRHSIDRIDNNGHYEPGNVRWATKEVQANNTRTNRFVEFDGRLKSVADWARETGIRAPTISSRLRKGWAPDRAITTPVLAFAGRNSEKFAQRGHSTGQCVICPTK